MIVLWLVLAAALLFLGQRRVFARFWRRNLSMRVTFDRDAAAAGEDVTVTEQLKNRKLLPLPMLRCGYVLQRNFTQLNTADEKRLQIRWCMAVPGRRSVVRRHTLHGLPRGVYSVAEGQLTSQDLFCTQEYRMPFTSFARLTVWPEKLDAKTLSLPYRRLLGAVLTRRPTQEDPFELRGIRPYEIYDSMRMINWKATAKTGELKVNQNDYTTDEAVCLILDLEHGETAQQEQAISVVSSLAERFLERGVNVSVIANGRSCIGGREIRVGSGSGAAHLRVIDGSLAQIKVGAQPTRSAAALLGSLHDRGVHALCVLVTADTSEELGAAFDALCLRDRGFVVQLSKDDLPGSRFEVLHLLEQAETEAAS